MLKQAVPSAPQGPLSGQPSLRRAFPSHERWAWVSSGTGEMPRTFPLPRSISSPRDGTPIPCCQTALDDFLERLLGLFPAVGDFFPGCHRSAALLYLPAQEQGAGSLGWLPLARVPSLAARGSDSAHLPSNGCRAGPGRAGTGTRWSHRLLHRDPILLAGKPRRCHQNLALSRHLAFLSLAFAADVGTRRLQSCQVSAHSTGRPPCWERRGTHMLVGTLEPGQHIAAAFMACVSLIHEIRICSEKDLTPPSCPYGRMCRVGQ